MLMMTNEDFQRLKGSYVGMCDGIKDLIVTLRDREDVGVHTTLSIVRLSLCLIEFDKEFSKIFNDLSTDLGSDVTVDDPADTPEEIEEIRAIRDVLQVLVDTVEKHKE